MPSVYELKPRFQALLRPALAPLARLGLTANGVTCLALAGSIGVGVALTGATQRPWLLLLLPLWLLLRMALNAVDGMMARELDMRSNLGAVLNELGDVLSDVALYLPLAMLTPESRWPAIALVLGALLSEFAGVLALALGATRRYDGPMGKSDRAFWVGALALVGFLWPRSLDLWPWLLSGAAFLTLWTTRNRLARALAELRERRTGASA